MSEGKIEKCTVNNLTYFSYFNHKLYENPTYFIAEENDNNSNQNNQSLDESTDNASLQSINSINKEDRYIPLNLLDLSPTKQSISFIPKKEEKRMEWENGETDFIENMELFFNDEEIINRLSDIFYKQI